MKRNAAANSYYAFESAIDILISKPLNNIVNGIVTPAPAVPPRFAKKPIMIMTNDPMYSKSFNGKNDLCVQINCDY